MAVPLLDINRQHGSIREELDRAVAKVLDHGRFILGSEVVELEQEIAALCGVKYAIGVASGTDSLLVALHACGVGPGDEVVTSDFSFFASASVATRLGAKPVFVDIDPDTYNMDPEKLQAAITKKTKAIMPVHLFGQCADMDPIMEIARKQKIRIVEDAAQAIGSTYKGKKAGAIGDIGCLSFYPTKNLGCAGDGGMIVTDDEELYQLCRILRVHGAEPKYYHRLIGYNSRLDTLQAAILLVKLKKLGEWTEGRRANAAYYHTELSGLPIKTPVTEEWAYHIYNQYTIAVDNRDALGDYLKQKKIGYEIYYPVPFHLQECFAGLGYRENDFPVSEKAARSVISLPIFGELTSEEKEEVVQALRSFYA
jgi:dTDP-4-amino-4,6-dideoxygalactose transaminase